jgi:hypothetical protein
MSDIIIWILLIFTFLIIIGLYSSEFTPLDLNEKKKILDLNYITENFTPEMSTSTEQSQGAPGLYRWGLPEDNVVIKEKDDSHKCKESCSVDCPLKYKKIEEKPKLNKECIEPPKNINLREVCGSCDITLNKNIDKYVLKSSVPACPDMSEYVTKNMMNTCPDLNDYILKSEIKACEKVDMSKYILKSQIPACPTCPICPECPICPVCPKQEPQKPCKEIHQYNITEHPDLGNYIKKDDVLNSDIVKNYINQNANNMKKTIHQEELIRNGNVNSNVNNSNVNNSNVNKGNVNSKKGDDLLSDNVIGYYAGDSLFAGV